MDGPTVVLFRALGEFSVNRLKNIWRKFGPKYRNRTRERRRQRPLTSSSRNISATRMASSAASPIISSRYLTKSLFVKACECPRKLAYALSPDFTEQKPSDFLQNLAETGMKIGMYSRLLFRDGIEIGKQQQLTGKRTVEELVEETNNLLNSSENVTLFEAAITHGPFYVRADILRKTGDHHLKLMEVKAKAWDSRKGIPELMLTKKGGIRSDYLPYLQDVAFQKMVVQRAFPEMKVSASLVLPDKALVNTQIPNLNSMFEVVRNKCGKTQVMIDEGSRRTILDAQEMLVTEVLVDDLVEQVLESELTFPGCDKGQTFRDVVTEWGDLVEEGACLEAFSPPPIGKQCSSCQFRSTDSDIEEQQPSGFEMCWNEAAGISPEFHRDLVTNLYHGGSTVEKLVSMGKFLMSDITPEDLGLSENGEDLKKKDLGLSRKEKQWHQASNTESMVLDYAFLDSEMSSWKYPYHFVDFETILPALPYSTDQTPYTALAFQFSHHTMDEEGTVQHVSEFLHAIPGECPNRPFLVALEDSIGGREGTVFRWGAHEITILAALLRTEAGAYPVVESLMTGGDRAMVDLMQVLNKGCYAPGSGASSSIKKLLVPMMKASEHLKEIYSQPNYSGSNFTNMQWWVDSSEDGVPCDPYTLLGTFENEGKSVAQGGDAIVAYEALQKGSLDQDARSTLKASLLRYCELDTLAMAMMMQGIQDLLRKEKS